MTLEEFIQLYKKMSNKEKVTRYNSLSVQDRLDFLGTLTDENRTSFIVE